MEPCFQSVDFISPCAMCGRRAEKTHRPLFRRGPFCPRCCPVCAAKLASAGVTPREADPPTQGAAEQKEGRWGPDPHDAWYRDERRFPPPWIPRRPNWFN
jgi:hypothetical protein